MSKKKNLERAIVLGLILSTGVYGNAWAETIENFKNTADNNSNIVVKADTTVDGTRYYGPDVSSGSGPEQPKHILKNSLFEIRGGNIVNMTVTAGNVQLTFNDVNMLSPHIIRTKGTNGADIHIVNDNATTDTSNSNKDFAGINVSAYIEGNSLTLNSIGRGIYTGVGKNAYPIIVDGQAYRNVSIDVNDQVKITSASDGIFNEGENVSAVTITAGNVIIDANARNGIYNAAGRYTDVGNDVSVTAEKGNIKINLKDTTDRIDLASVKNTTNGKTELTALKGAINLDSTRSGIWATKGEVSLKSGFGNTIKAQGYSVGNEFYGKGISVHAEGTVDDSTTVDLNAAAGNNELYGAVAATGAGANVNLTHNDNNGNSGSGSNFVYSAAVIANAGGLSDTVISALYAENGANISVSGERNVIRTYADYDKPEELERVVWAYDTADIKIDGASIIGTDTYEKSRNSNDIAIAAGTATNLNAGEVNAPVADRATVTLNYDNFITNDGKQAVSEITGDILSAYAGQVDIIGKSADAGIKITGNLLAGNNGILNVNLGKGGVLTGRADDYGDAGANKSGVGSGNDGHQSSEFFDPAFSSKIFKGGEVNLTMGENSRWNVTGQSWITRINTAENSNAIIDLVGSNTDRNTTAHALTVYEMNGDANFNMNLDADRDVSDMLYIKNAKGNYVVNVIDAVTEDDMYAARTDGGTFDGLRFATVGKGSTASFRAITYDGGFNNVEYIIGSDSYDESTENHHYNGDSLDAEKPGDSTVDDFFENNGKPGSTTGATNGLAKASLMALPVNETNNAENDDLTNVEVNTDETTNFKLIGVKNTEISDAGKTMLNMSRANYSNAIYMDRLNKRLGEARYINSEEDEGMWVRIRHDRIGKDDAYRSQNTMYELGYDKKQECDNGERRVGMAIDYMHGDTGYDQIAGKGEIDRYGLWLYDTWMGDKGHYADYVAKWGHLSNDFEIYNSRGEVTGDYSNNVFSVSAEYGRKKDIGNDWYFEPQVQAQLARVTGADYTTSQGTKVSVDGINSLIGRAGFRLGKDFGEEKQSTVYIKADVLHEFLGDQDIRAFDGTTSGWQTVSYENEGTWYDVGLGFAAMMSKSSYAFLDLERSFGHDNDETYQINVGMQWSF